MSTNLLVVDESQIQKPQPCQFRTPAMIAGQYRTLEENARLSAADSSVAEREAATLEKECREADSAVAKLSELGAVSSDITVKLFHLKERLVAAQRNADVSKRISLSRKEGLNRFLAEGTPTTNAELLHQDSILEKALTSVRRAIGF
jgi:hypothetical protein